MIIELNHWVALIAATTVSFIYFRDLGDITQAFLTVRRKGMIFAIRHERLMISVGLVGTIITILTVAKYDAGFKFLAYGLGVINIFSVGFPYVWLYFGLRNQQDHAKYYSIVEAKDYLRSDESVIVLENKGETRAHSDYFIKRPHLAGSPEGLGGENINMTYCCMIHLGHGYKPEIDGEKLDLEMVAQHGNNLIMRDKNTGEPVQQMYGTR